MKITTDFKMTGQKYQLEYGICTWSDLTESGPMSVVRGEVVPVDEDGGGAHGSKIIT